MRPGDHIMGSTMLRADDRSTIICQPDHRLLMIVRIVSFGFISLEQFIHFKTRGFVQVCPAIRVTLILIFDFIDSTTGI